MIDTMTLMKPTKTLLTLLVLASCLLATRHSMASLIIEVEEVGGNTVFTWGASKGVGNNTLDVSTASGPTLAFGALMDFTASTPRLFSTSTGALQVYAISTPLNSLGSSNSSATADSRTGSVLGFFSTPTQGRVYSELVDVAGILTYADGSMTFNGETLATLGITVDLSGPGFTVGTFGLTSIILKSSTTAVPEPTTFLGCLGLICSAFLRRPRRALG